MQYLTCPHCNAVYLGDTSRAQCPQCQTVVAQPQVAGSGSVAESPIPASPRRKRKLRTAGRGKSLNIGLVFAGLAMLGVLLLAVGYVAVNMDSSDASGTAANQNDQQPATGVERLSITRADFRRKAAGFPQGPNYKTGQQWHLSGRHWVMAFGPPHENSYKNVDQTMVWRCRDGNIAVICLARPEPLAERNSPKGEKLIVKRIENVSWVP